MSRHRKLLIAVACLTTVIASVALLKRKPEPAYQGRSLSRWLKIYYESDRLNRDRSQRPVAAAAIRAIGTNALPRLLEWIPCETPSWHYRLAGALPSGIDRRILESRPLRATVYRKYHQAEAARQALGLLGADAAGAIPALTSMMHDEAHPQTAMWAMEFLSRFGPRGFQELDAALANPTQPFRDNLAYLIAVRAAPLVGTNICLPGLRAAMDDPNPKVRAAADYAILRLTSGTTNTPQPRK